jgi:DNA polymerase III subunit epsilon
MLGRLLGLELQRRYLLRKATAGPMRAYLERSIPDRRSDYRQVEYLAVDLETTGLNPRQEHILSIGLVLVKGVCIDLSSARHILLRTSRDIPEASAVIHQITDDQAARGRPIGEVLPQILRLLAGRVMIAHYAHIERGFLSTACAALYGLPLPVATVDTQAIALRWFQQRDRQVAPRELRLYALRERYNLPRYPAHNALSDALAVAELFLAQTAHRDPGGGLPLRQLLLPP